MDAVGIVAHAALAYAFCGMLVYTSLPFCLRVAQDYVKAERALDVEDFTSRAALTACVARSLALVGVCGPAFFGFLRDDKRAPELVLGWATIMLAFKLCGLALDLNTNRGAFLIFAMMMGSFFMHHGVVSVLAVLAAGNTVRSLDFMIFAAQHAFPEPGRGSHWEKALLIGDGAQRGFRWLEVAEMLMVAEIFVRMVLAGAPDPWLFVLTMGLALAYKDPVEYDIYARAPPPVRRDARGRLTRNLYQRLTDTARAGSESPPLIQSPQSTSAAEPADAPEESTT